MVVRVHLESVLTWGGDDEKGGGDEETLDRVRGRFSAETEPDQETTSVWFE